ncbi:MAG: M23 family metallopeptidase [Oscillibacter sp.]|nr:M23 family metallopeptidase [Oscillibacter sp.]
MAAQAIVQQRTEKREKARRAARARVRVRGRTVRKGGGRTDRRDQTGDRLALQLAVCGGAFVLLVAAKVLVPGQAAALRQSLSGTMERNLDVEEVFSAVGRAVSGEENGAEEVWQAVFSPLEPDLTEAADGPAASEMAEDAVFDGTAYSVDLRQGGFALEVLRQYRASGIETKETEGSPARTEEPADVQSGPQAGTQPGTQMDADGKPLPDNVSMEQRILNFAYCTPVFGHLTSGFGWRTDPIQGGERFHHGVDLAAASGTDILCFANGTVAAVGESTSYGKYCIVDHPGNFSTLYAHCSRITAASGSAVSLGDKIAEVGATGAATGPHLHFELHQGSLYLNPIYYVDHS